MASKIEFESKSVNPDNEGVFDVSPDEVRTKKDQVQLVDVRRPDEYEGELGHIPGAQLITLDTLPHHLGEVSKDQTVVFICRSGGRSGKATAFALENGYQDVYNMKGGMLAWNEKNYETKGKPE